MFFFQEKDFLKKGKDGRIYSIKYDSNDVIAKVFRKNKNRKDIKNEYYFLKKAYKLGISPKVYYYSDNIEKRYKEDNGKEDNSYIIMEKLDKTLLDFIRKTGKLSIDHQKKIIKILEILDENKIFHGDISPLNFMTKKDKDDKTNLYIIDFGMSKKMDDDFIKKYGKDANVKIGITAFILKIREFIPSFDPILLKKKVFSKLDI